MNIEGMAGRAGGLELQRAAGREQAGAKGSDQVFQVNKPSEGEKTKAASPIPQMVEDISKVKEQLEHDLTLENLQRYKEAVRAFLDYFTKHELKKETFFVRDGRTFLEKRVSIVTAVDEKINHLSENMLETNRGHLETLHQIGEIQGLIVNLFL